MGAWDQAQQPPTYPNSGGTGAGQYGPAAAGNSYALQNSLFRASLIPEMQNLGRRELGQTYDNSLARQLLAGQSMGLNRQGAQNQQGWGEQMFDVQGGGLGLQRQGLGLDKEGLNAQQMLARQLYGSDLGRLGSDRGYMGEQFGSDLGRLGLERQGIGAERGYLNANDALAKQLFGIGRQETEQQFQTGQRNAVSDAVGRGASGSPGLGNTMADQAAQRGFQLGRIGVEEGRQKAGFGRDTTQLGLREEGVGLDESSLRSTFAHDTAGLGFDEKDLKAKYGFEQGNISRGIRQLGLDDQALGLAADKLGIERGQARTAFDKSMADFDVAAQQLGIDRTELDQRLWNGLEGLGLQTLDEKLAAMMEISNIASKNPDIWLQILGEQLTTAQGTP